MTYKFMHRCQLPDCGRTYQHGPGLYEGKFARLYDLEVCSVCWEGDWDGWNPRYDAFLLRRLRDKGLPVPDRIAGLLPRG